MIIQYRINRNIVECKGIYRNCIEGVWEVLIETSWNVKDSFSQIFPWIYSVLIETSWNVKNVTFSIIVFPDLCINRNIVECKVVGEYTSFIILSSINRNIVECKVWICISMKRFVLVLIETSWNVKEPSWICYEWKKECELPDILTLVF